MSKLVRSKYTVEFKQEAVRLVEAGQSLATVSRSIGVSTQTLHNWVKLSKQNALTADNSKPTVTPEQMEISRLKAELSNEAGCDIF